MALEPRRVERWLRDAYPTQEVHDRVEWHAEGSMVQCFVRLDDRVVLIHLEGEGERTVLKGRLEIPLDLWKPDPPPRLPTGRYPIQAPDQRSHVQQPRRSGARVRTKPGALAHRDARRLDATSYPEPATFRFAGHPDTRCETTRDRDLRAREEGTAGHQRHA